MIKIPFINELKLIKRCLINVEHILENEKRLIVAIKENLIHQNHFLKDHIQKLNYENLDHSEISYGLRLAARHSEIKLTGHDVGNILVCTVAVGDEYREKMAKCLGSQKEYCQNKGYVHAELTHACTDAAQRPAPWLKIPLLYCLMDMGFTKIAFIDADCLITNPSVDLEIYFSELEAKQKCILIGEDEGGINTGVMFIKKSSAAFRLMDLIWLNDADIYNGTWEQNVLKEYLSYYPQIGNLIDIADSSQNFNRFPSERLSLYSYRMIRQVNEWKRGDFICHFSGIRSPHLEELIEKYSKNTI